MAEGKTTDPDMVRLTADLPVGTIEILRELAESQNINLTEALRRAVANEHLLRKRVKQEQNRLLLESKDGRLSELLIRD